MKILTVIGARPQFVKAAVVSKALLAQSRLNEIILHTGQHFDTNMSDVFFEQLEIPRPSYQLDIHGGPHGQMTGRMLEAIERIILLEKPDRLLVYGDTNSTLAGALAAIKQHIPVAHVEAGLRSFNMRMPEEINRLVTDQVSDVLFCPTTKSVENLMNEGFGQKPVTIFQVGDVMQDSTLCFKTRATPPPGMEDMPLFVLATLHRADNTDDPERLSNIVNSLNLIHRAVAPVVLPLHPRTRQIIEKLGLALQAHVIEPVGYFEMLWLLEHCGIVLTDSGGVQKEAFFFGKPCVTIRDETEWVETLAIGANQLVGADQTKILEAVKKSFGLTVIDEQELYGGGRAAEKIANLLASLPQ